VTQLLAEAGRPSGIDVTLYAGSGTMVNDKFLLETMADMWTKVGILAKIEMMEMGARQACSTSVPSHRMACSWATRSRRALYTEATQIIHDEKPRLELFQEVIVYGVSRLVSFKPRPDYRLIVSEMAASR